MLITSTNRPTKPKLDSDDIKFFRTQWTSAGTVTEREALGNTADVVKLSEQMASLEPNQPSFRAAFDITKVVGQRPVTEDEIQREADDRYSNAGIIAKNGLMPAAGLSVLGMGVLGVSEFFAPQLLSGPVGKVALGVMAGATAGSLIYGFANRGKNKAAFVEQERAKNRTVDVMKPLNYQGVVAQKDSGAHFLPDGQSEWLSLERKV